MASIVRKLLIGMLVPYAWRRWRGRNQSRPAAHQPAPTEAEQQLSAARASG